MIIHVCSRVRNSHMEYTYILIVYLYFPFVIFLYMFVKIIVFISLHLSCDKSLCNRRYIPRLLCLTSSTTWKRAKINKIK